MHQNIQLAVQNTEALSVLEEKSGAIVCCALLDRVIIGVATTEAMTEQGKKFNDNTKKLKSQMWWKYCKVNATHSLSVLR